MQPQTFDPTTFQAQQGQLSRRRALMEALLQRSMQGQQGQMVGKHFVAPSATSTIASLLAGGGAVMANRDMDQQELGLAKQYQQGQASALGSYLKTREGIPGESMSTEQARALMEQDQAPQLADPVAGDPRRAAVQAVASSFPALQKLGMQDVETMGKAKTEETFGHSPVTERGPDGSLVSVLYGNRGTRRLVEGATPYEKPMTVADRLIDPANPSKPLANYATTGGEIYTDTRGDKYQIMSDGTHKKLDNASKTVVTVSPQTTVVNKGAKAGAETWAKLAGQTVSEMAAEARGSVKFLGTLSQLEASGKAGVFSGPTASPAIFMSGLAESLGLPVDRAKLANSQTFEAASISAWQDMVKQAGGNRGVVKEESQKLAQMVPQLSQSPQGRAQLTAYLRQLARSTIQDAQRAQQEYGQALESENLSKFTFGLSSAELPRTQPSGPAPGSVPAASKPVVKNW